MTVFIFVILAAALYIYWWVKKENVPDNAKQILVDEKVSKAKDTIEKIMTDIKTESEAAVPTGEISSQSQAEGTAEDEPQGDVVIPDEPESIAVKFSRKRVSKADDVLERTVIANTDDVQEKDKEMSTRKRVSKAQDVIDDKLEMDSKVTVENEKPSAGRKRISKSSEVAEKADKDR